MGKYVIQACITVTNERQRCSMCNKQLSSFLYVNYENANATIAREAEIDINSARDPAQRANTSPYNDRIYEATLREQHNIGPAEHGQHYDCFMCLAGMITDGMNISDVYGFVVLRQLRSFPSSHALWIIRDTTQPDRWATTFAPHHDPVLLATELGGYSILRLTKTGDG